MKKFFPVLLLACGFGSLNAQPAYILRADGHKLSTASIDSIVGQLMDTARVTGLYLGIVENGKPAYIKAYGYRHKGPDAYNDTATSIYAASFSKAVFAVVVMHLAEEGILDLDRPLYHYLPKPLPEYDKYKDLASDDRWKLLTARICLDHTTGFPNFRWFNPVHDNTLEFFFRPGSRYAYSGEGLVLLQFVIETITHKPLEQLAKESVFQPLGMQRTSYLWQPAFEADHAVGYDAKEDTVRLKRRDQANAAGSMQTTIADYTRFVAGVLRNEVLSAKTRAEMIKPQIRIFSPYQFPTLDSTVTQENQDIQLSYGLGWGLFTSPYGKIFFKEGHDDGWEHYGMALPEKGQAFIIMTNSSNGESIFKELFERLSAITIPWKWENYTPLRHL